jgi:hypothetical protein
MKFNVLTAVTLNITVFRGARLSSSLHAHQTTRRRISEDGNRQNRRSVLLFCPQRVGVSVPVPKVAL